MEDFSCIHISMPLIIKYITDSGKSINKSKWTPTFPPELGMDVISHTLTWEGIPLLDSSLISLQIVHFWMGLGQHFQTWFI